MIVSAIAAMALNRVIGKNNQLPWHYPEDLKFFRDKTKGRVLIMGRKTFDSLGKPLPGRFHIVVSRSMNVSVNDMVRFVQDIPQALCLAEEIVRKDPRWGDEIFVVGGGEIYRQSIPHWDRLYLTLIQEQPEGDAHFPEFPAADFVVTKESSSPGLVFLEYHRRR